MFLEPGQAGVSSAPGAWEYLGDVGAKALDVVGSAAGHEVAVSVFLWKGDALAHLLPPAVISTAQPAAVPKRNVHATSGNAAQSSAAGGTRLAAWISMDPLDNNYAVHVEESTLFERTRSSLPQSGLTRSGESRMRRSASAAAHRAARAT
jgi:hypothetical protein